ncbi:MAG: tetratricopeptide repeat protein, partial [Kiritimatiellia bacterium]
MTSRRTGLTNDRFLVGAGTLSLIGVSFTLSCLLVAAHPTQNESQGRSIAAALLGESRLALSGHFYEMADTYFHRGVGHVHEEAFSDGFFQKIHKQFSPREHVHVKGRQINEIMPWLKLAIRMDPHNVELYTVAAFWLATEGRRPDTALDVLRQALANNPYCYQAQLELGRIYLQMGKLSEAKRAFDAGLAFWEKAAKKESSDAHWDRAALLLYRALLHEA